MITGNYKIKMQACNLCDALRRNINDNFESVSFEINDAGNIIVKIRLIKKTEVEEEYIEDLMVEFSALQEKDNIEKVIVTTDINSQPFENIVYQKKVMLQRW